ncbi:MAG: sulfotransferase [Gammaproteobacteria bacterium]
MNRTVLVFGLPRTGTTWIGKLFDSHPDTLYRHEPDSVYRLSMPLFPDKSEASRYQDELAVFIRSLPDMRTAKIAGKQPLFPKHYHGYPALLAYRTSAAFVRFAARIKPGITLPYRPTAAGYERRCLVWKSIESLGRLGACVEALPDTRAIHILRHPCGYVASVLRGEASDRFQSRVASSEDYGIYEMLLDAESARSRGLTLQDLEKLTPEERLAWRWVLTHEKALADTEHLDRVLTVRYEDVCTDPMHATHKMFEHSGLSWQQQTQNFILASTARQESGYHSVFKDSRKSADGWRSELDPQVTERITKVLQHSSLNRFYDGDLVKSQQKCGYLA